MSRARARAQSGDVPEDQPTGIDKRATQEQVDALYGLKKSSALDSSARAAAPPEAGSWIQVSDAFQRLIGSDGGADESDDEVRRRRRRRRRRSARARNRRPAPLGAHENPTRARLRLSRSLFRAQRADTYLDQEPPHPLDGVSATYDQAIDIEFHRQQQLVQVMESEKTFLREFVGMLKGGFRLIKHSRSGAASMRILKISSDGREISWELKRAAGESPAPAAARGAAAGGENVVFSLNEIRTVRRAIPVASVPKVHAERCFTLVVNSRAVVFEAIDAATRELIVDGAPPPRAAPPPRSRRRPRPAAKLTRARSSLVSRRVFAHVAISAAAQGGAEAVDELDEREVRFARSSHSHRERGTHAYATPSHARARAREVPSSTLPDSPPFPLLSSSRVGPNSGLMKLTTNNGPLNPRSALLSLRKRGRPSHNNRFSRASVTCTHEYTHTSSLLLSTCPNSGSGIRR